MNSSINLSIVSIFNKGLHALIRTTYLYGNLSCHSYISDNGSPSENADSLDL